MNSVIIFAVKAALYLSAFYIVYFILLSKDTSYGRNRAYILVAGLLSLLMPLITLQTSRPLDIQYLGKMLNDVFITATPERSSYKLFFLKGAGTFQIIFTIYILGVSLLIIKLLADLINLFILISRHKEKGSSIIRFHSFNTPGFSAMGYIFINSRLNSDETFEIIRHEQNHLKNNHFLDIIFIELVKAFQWFNPVVYLFDRSLRAIHEYQADQECLSSGITVVNYQNLLLNQVFRTKAFNLTNSFSNPSMVRKRMIMMTRKRTPSVANLKMLLAIPAAGIIFLAISAYNEIPVASGQNSISSSRTRIPDSGDQLKTNSEIPETEPFVQVEEMPIFPGGNEALLKFLAENTSYPEHAKENNLQGRVIIKFCISEKGTINRVSVLKSIDPELDAEAIRVINKLPSFVPGKNGGKAVSVWYMVPITFTLN